MLNELALEAVHILLRSAQPQPDQWQDAAAKSLEAKLEDAISQLHHLKHLGQLIDKTSLVPGV